jgi:hypothetical protein
MGKYRECIDTRRTNERVALMIKSHINIIIMHDQCKGCPRRTLFSHTTSRISSAPFAKTISVKQKKCRISPGTLMNAHDDRNKTEDMNMNKICWKYKTIHDEQGHTHTHNTQHTYMHTYIHTCCCCVAYVLCVVCVVLCVVCMYECMIVACAKP